MDLRRPTIAMISFNHTRQKQQIIQQQQQHNLARHPRWMQTLSPPMNTGSAESQVANLQQCISAYLDSIQMVCRAGSWLSETLAFLLRESSSGAVADEMKSRFTGMLQLSVSTTLQAKNELAQILMKLSLPNLSNNNQTQAIKDCKAHNAKVLEKCMYCLSTVHNSFFKAQLNIKSPPAETEPTATETDNNGDSKENKNPQDSNNSPNSLPVEKPSIDFASEWTKLSDTTSNVKSWFALKEHTGNLRKYNGLTDTEIQNLLKKSESVSHLYLKKLNQKIDTALRNYEVGLRGLPSESVVVFGGFYSSPDRARLALKGCCSPMEMEQDIQRLPVSQFLHCELPLMAFMVNKKEYPAANSSNSPANISQKKNAVSHLIQSTNQKLSISETDELSSEILGEICPARWRTHAKASLQLLYGNSGLVLMDTVSRESRNKQNAQVSQIGAFIVVAVSSTWCIKEDPGTMSLLQRNLDPEKTLATIHVRYVAVYNSKPNTEKRFEPGIFVEAFVQTGSQNRRRASQTLRASQSISGMPVTPMSACWLSQQNVPQGSPVLLSRVMGAAEAEAKGDTPGGKLATTLKKSSSVKSEGGDSGSERRRKKKIVVEIKSDTASEEEKSSDNEDSVRDVIHLLSGSSRRSTRRRFQIEREAKEAETDLLSEVIEKILDSDLPDEKDESVEKDAESEKAEEKQTSPVESEEPNKAIIQQHTRSKSDVSQYESVEGKFTENIKKSPEPQSNPSIPNFSPPLSQSQTNLVQSPLSDPPFHQKSKSQTLPLSYQNLPQNTPSHQFSKSMSNTLPQLRGRNLPQPTLSNPLSHPYPALPSKQNLNLPNNFHHGPNPMQIGPQPQDPRLFLRQQFNPQQLQAYSSTSPVPPSLTGISRNPGLQTHPGYVQPPSPNLQGQPHQYTMKETQYMMGPGSNLPPSMQQDPEPPMVPAMSPYPQPSNDDNLGQILNQTGNVQALLQHFNKLAMEAKHTQVIGNENQRFDQNVTLQQLLMLGQNDNLQQNSNNNNIPVTQHNMRPGGQDRHGIAPPSNSPRWDMGGPAQRMDVNNNTGGRMSQTNMSQRSQMLNQNNNMDNNTLGYNTALMHATFQQQMRMRQEMGVQDDLRSKSPNQMDQFVQPSQHGSLGPIGSPVITRRRTNEMSPPMHLTPQHQGSNTWPSVHDLPIPAVQQSEGDAEYEQYVAGITKNAIQRKIMSQHSIDELEATGKVTNTWDMQPSGTWQPGPDPGDPVNNSFSVFDTPDLVQHIRGHETNFTEEEIKQPASMEGNTDPARTGTWPPWQLWQSPGNGNLWNWSNDLLNTASSVENPHPGQRVENTSS